MRSHDQIEEYRIDTGGSTALGCLSCPLRDLCGGIQRARGAWTCMDLCPKSCERGCDLVCLNNNSTFVRAIDEVRGLDCRDIEPICGPAVLSGFPRYIPTIQHGNAWDRPIRTTWAAVPLRVLMTGRKRLSCRFDSAWELRAALGVDEATNIAVLGTGPDQEIERYWRGRRTGPILEQLANLRLNMVIAPNYSLFLDDPRPQHLFNRKRSLICAEELSRAGLPTVPYLSGITEADWSFWASFLRERPDITMVAKEFQTGLSHPEQGRRALLRLRRLQDRIGRPLHVLIIGGTRFRQEIGAWLRRWTIIDSSPFFRAVKRRQAIRKRPHRVDWVARPGSSVASLFETNFQVYSQWINEKVPS